MNSLTISRAAFSKIAIALVLIATLAGAIAGQRVEPQRRADSTVSRFSRRAYQPEWRQCRHSRHLSYITDQYGINFVIDKR